MKMKRWFLGVALFEVCVLVLLLIIVATAHQTYRKTYTIENDMDTINMEIDSLNKEVKMLNNYLYD